MQFNYVTLPARSATDDLTPNQLRVLLYLYSLVFHNKYKVKVRQEVIAKRCHTSVATVRRAVSVLEKLGYIVSKYRSHKRNGYLGTYTYYLSPVGTKHFRVDRRIAMPLSNELLYLYILCSKCANNSSHWFFHSYSDISFLLGIKQRSKVIALVKKLTEMHVIKKITRTTTFGDFAENIYFITTFTYSIPKLHAKVKSILLIFRPIIIIPTVIESKVKPSILFYFYFKGGGDDFERSKYNTHYRNISIRRRKYDYCIYNKLYNYNYACANFFEGRIIMVKDNRAYKRIRSVRNTLLRSGVNDSDASAACFCLVFGLIAEANDFFLGRPLTLLLCKTKTEQIHKRFSEFMSELQLDFLPKLQLPMFSHELHYKLMDCCAIDWRGTTPDVLGALYELTLADRTGVYFTSKQNIHRCIDPLFIDDLLAELEEASGSREKLEKLYQKLCSITVLDPACGTGNYLIEALASLRSIESQIIGEIGEQPYRIDFTKQIFGIEIEPISSRLCRAALFLQNRISDRLAALTAGIPLRSPLELKENILCGDSLEVNWMTFSAKPITYIIGNPPFTYRPDEEQREKMQLLFDHSCKELDYAAAWVRKAAFCCIKGSRAALLTTSSICQGKQVYPLWNSIFSDNVEIIFAYQPFKWTTDYDAYTDVIWTHCVVVGLAMSDENIEKRIYQAGKNRDKCIKAHQINGYLRDLPKDLFIFKKDQPSFTQRLCSDRSGRDYITEEQYRTLLDRGVAAEQYVPYIKAKESLYGTTSYIKRTAESDAKYPRSDYIVLCRHFSGKREYMPVLYFSNSRIVCDESTYWIKNADLFTFGLLCSSMHNAWIALTCGRLDNNIRYSIDLAYNTFPIPQASEAQKKLIVDAAQALLEEQYRCLPNYPCLADMLDDMPLSLKAAYMRLDVYVDKLYSTAEIYSNEKRIELLVKAYEQEGRKA